MSVKTFSDAGSPQMAAAVTPSDTTDLASPSRWIYIGVTGNLTVIMASDLLNTGAGSAVTFSNMPVGMYQISARRIKATGTTATGIVALW